MDALPPELVERVMTFLQPDALVCLVHCARRYVDIAREGLAVSFLTLDLAHHYGKQQVTPRWLLPRDNAKQVWVLSAGLGNRLPVARYFLDHCNALATTETIAAFAKHGHTEAVGHLWDRRLAEDRRRPTPLEMQTMLVGAIQAMPDARAKDTIDFLVHTFEKASLSPTTNWTPVDHNFFGKVFRRCNSPEVILRLFSALKLEGTATPTTTTPLSPVQWNVCVSCGNLSMLNWGVAHGHFDPDDSSMLERMFSTVKSVSVLDWWWEASARLRNIEPSSWGCVFDRAVRSTFEEGRPLVEWLRDHPGRDVLKSCGGLAMAIFYGAGEELEWVKFLWDEANGLDLEWDPAFCAHCILLGCPDLLALGLQGGAPISMGARLWSTGNSLDKYWNYDAPRSSQPDCFKRIHLLCQHRIFGECPLGRVPDAPTAYQCMAAAHFLAAELEAPPPIKKWEW